MNRSLVLLAALTAVASLQVPSVTASIIGPGTKIGFDIQGGTSGTTTYSFPGVLLNADSTWNITSSNISAGSVVDATGTVVDGVSMTRFGSTWRSWGSLSTAGKTNSVTLDYLFDNNNVNIGAHNARLDLSGLDDGLSYNVVVHAARLQNSNDINGAVVYINSESFVIPDVDSGGAALWPDGGFEVGRTSALFEHVNTNGSGGIEIYFDKINGEPIILTGLEIEAAAVPEPRSVVIYSLLIVCVIGLSRWRRRPRNGGGSPRSPRIEVRLPGGE